jgi:hypothetical protein
MTRQRASYPLSELPLPGSVVSNDDQVGDAYQVTLTNIGSLGEPGCLHENSWHRGLSPDHYHPRLSPGYRLVNAIKPSSSGHKPPFAISSSESSLAATEREPTKFAAPAEVGEPGPAAAPPSPEISHQDAKPVTPVTDITRDDLAIALKALQRLRSELHNHGTTRII